ncbi:MAG: hypothetical protein LBB74_01180 [Chitinispirillales bacterium]|jgi:2',3'-cyclic-nucleotide 2'-phosphodiesterase (5'-nucleotidase family)|nr:hypothetical protein [Chitinispirillales bacterium]
MKPPKRSNSQNARSLRLAGAVVAASFFVAAFVSPHLAQAAEINVIYSGETHAMLSPADSGGGFAERAAVLGGFPSDARLLIDGGGFAGGGIYDTYSVSRAADSVRTLKAIVAMGLMGYDAVGVGDDDLIYGGQWLVDAANRAGVPLVSANLFRAGGKNYLVDPYIIVKKGENTFAVTSVSTTERLFPVDSTVVVKDPAASLETIRREMKRKGKDVHLVLISHLGEDSTAALLKKIPHFFLAANGHRKVSVQPLNKAAKTPMLNFGFQGKQLSQAVLEWKGHSGLQVSKNGWINIDGGAGVDPKVAAVVSGPKAVSAKTSTPAASSTDANASASDTSRVNAPYVNQPASAKKSAPAAVANQSVSQIPDSNRVYDLYIMSLCPYGIQALSDLAELIRAFPQREWNVWFIGRAEGDKLSSLRGDPEMFDERLWLAVKALYPYRYHEFLFLRASSKAPTENLLNEMGFNVGNIRKWAEDAGPDELRKHYIRSTGLNVNASPTLYVNNNVYNKRIGGGRLVREECNAVAVKPDFCGDYPECFEDGDCRAVGKIGRCVNVAGTPAACEFTDDAVFAVKVLIADSTLDSPEKQVIETLVEMLPGARVSVARLSSDEGKRTMAKYAPTALPFFYIDKRVEKAARFSAISKMLEGVSGGGYRLKKGAVKENCFPLRTEKPGAIEIYADPLMSDIGRVINLLISNPDLAKRVVLRPIITKDPRSADLSTQERIRNEEALRWFTIANDFPKKYHAYLEAYGEDVASSYWFVWLRKIGINQNRFLKRIDVNRPKLAAYWDELSQVTAGEPVMVLINNRLKVTPSGEMDLVRVLGSINY